MSTRKVQGGILTSTGLWGNSEKYGRREKAGPYRHCALQASRCRRVPERGGYLIHDLNDGPCRGELVVEVTPIQA